MADGARTFLALAAAVISLIFLFLSLFHGLIPSGPADAADPLLSAVCHRHPSRSLQLPWGFTGLCTRCTAFWAGMLAGSLLILGRKPSIPLTAAVLLIVPLIVDGSLQYSGLYESTSLLRSVTGAAAGFGLASLAGVLAGRRRTAGS